MNKDKPMKSVVRIAAAMSIVALLSGCGGEDFSGAYQTDGPWGKRIILNVDGDDAKMFFQDKSSAEISNVTEFKVDYSKERMFVDSDKSSMRLVFTRDVDERDLVCLNCTELLKKLPKKWMQFNAKPYDVDLMLEEQVKAKRAAEEEKRARIAEMKKLLPFEGDWVAKRHFKEDSLFIMTINPLKGVKHWAFTYSTANKLIEFDRAFKVDGGDLQLISKDDTTTYRLSDDGQQLRCVGCRSEQYWIKADPVKINQISYTRSLAGDPQESR
jgi:hypothetical protein